MAMSSSLLTGADTTLNGATPLAPPCSAARLRRKDQAVGAEQQRLAARGDTDLGEVLDCGGRELARAVLHELVEVVGLPIGRGDVLLQLEPALERVRRARGGEALGGGGAPFLGVRVEQRQVAGGERAEALRQLHAGEQRSEEHTSELQS